MTLPLSQPVDSLEEEKKRTPLVLDSQTWKEKVILKYTYFTNKKRRKLLQLCGRPFSSGKKYFGAVFIRQRVENKKKKKDNFTH